MKTIQLKLIILGDPAVGKTSLRRRYIGKNFEENYLMTIGADFTSFQQQISDVMVNGGIWDINGDITFNFIHNKYFEDSNGAIVVYDITNLDSLKNTENWIEKYVKHSKDKHGNIFLLANKIDLIGKGKEIDEFVEQQIVAKIRQKYSTLNIQTGRVSAKSGNFVDESFQKLLQQIVSQLSSKDKNKSSDNSDLQIWEFVKKYTMSRFTKCKGCKITFPNDENLLSCPRCNNMLKIDEELHLFVKNKE